MALITRTDDSDALEAAVAAQEARNAVFAASTAARIAAEEQSTTDTEAFFTQGEHDALINLESGGGGGGLSEEEVTTLIGQSTLSEEEVTTLIGQSTAFVPSSRSVSTTAPLTGGGSLIVGDLTLAVTASSESNAGAVRMATEAEVATPMDDEDSSSYLAISPYQFWRSGMSVIMLDVPDPATTGIIPDAYSFRMPCQFWLAYVRGSLVEPPTFITHIIDINVNGTSVLTNKLQIEAGETTSTTASNQVAVDFNARMIPDDAVVTLDFDEAAQGALGLKVMLVGKYVTATEMDGL